MIMRSRIWNPCTLVSEALVSSGPLWQLMHLPCPRKTPSPRSGEGSEGVGGSRAARFPSMNWSKGVLSAISSFSYSLTASPKYRLKLYSITVNVFAFAFCVKTGLLGLVRSTYHPGASHHAGSKAFLIRSMYFPTLVGPVRDLKLTPMPGELL